MLGNNTNVWETRVLLTSVYFSLSFIHSQFQINILENLKLWPKILRTCYLWKTVKNKDPAHTHRSHSLRLHISCLPLSFLPIFLPRSFSLWFECAFVCCSVCLFSECKACEWRNAWFIVIVVSQLDRSGAIRNCWIKSRKKKNWDWECLDTAMCVVREIVTCFSCLMT